MTRSFLYTVIAGALWCLTPFVAARAENPLPILQKIDEKEQRGDGYRALVYFEHKAPDLPSYVQQASTYSTDGGNKMVVLFANPKIEKGKGYLIVDRNIWFYDPNVGKWDRKTDRERLGGTGARRSDMTANEYARRYDAVYEGKEKLGNFTAHRIRLTIKKGFDVEFPTLRIWVDEATNNVLKREDYALSGKLIRTAYHNKWQKVPDPRKPSGFLWYPQETNFFDEVDKTSTTRVIIKALEVKSQNPNVFTKAWLEARSR